MENIEKDKDKLTNYVNSTYLTDNDKLTKLIKLLYSKLEPTLKQYNAILVLKGSTAIRLLHNNVINSFPDIINNELDKVFGKYLSQSDLDFEIIMKSKLKVDIEELSRLIYIKLKLVQDELLKNKSKYFTNWNKTPNNTTHKSRYSKANITLDNIIISNDKSQIYRTYTEDVLLKDIKSHFTLNRLKIGFSSIGKYGELIDITIKYPDDAGYLSNTKENRDKYISLEQYPFNYYVINTDYMLKDLKKMIFKDKLYPWRIEKRDKRIARYIYLNWLNEINTDGISNIVLNKLRLRLTRELKGQTRLLKENKARGHKNHETKVLSILAKLREITIKFNKLLAQELTTKLNIV